jgi:hypothetical protein
MAGAQDGGLSSPSEIGRRGDALCDQCVKPNVTLADEGEFVAIDVETGAYELDRDELAAEHRLLARRAGALAWITRVGSRYAHRFGAGHAIMRPQ